MELLPQPLSSLLRRLLYELARGEAIYDLPPHRMWRGAQRDLSLSLSGRRVSTPIGPAAGPHTQLSQNLVLGYLAGARIFELKTIQRNDTLRIARPCISARDLCYNVEWSQELRLPQSLQEYVKGWLLIHTLRRRLLLRPADVDFVFDASVGYDLAGITSDAVARFIDGLRDARPTIRALCEDLDPALRRALPDDIPHEVSNCVTLSTFHGCPPEEIERIVEHLFTRHAVDVVLKLNPTLLGHDEIAEILIAQHGYHDLVLHKPAFANDLNWSDALSLVERLRAAAKRTGRALSVKFSNTLVVENHRQILPASEPLLYLSGQPLHLLAITLAQRFAQATAGAVPISLSGGVDQQNCADVVACGIAPVTVCTDLLRAGGYGRLPKYLDGIEAALARQGVESVSALVQKNGGLLAALSAYAPKVLADARYGAAKNAKGPRRVDSELRLFDCLSCDKCVAVCPNDANFPFTTDPVRPLSTIDLVIGDDGTLRNEPGPSFALTEAHQIAHFADACNACGNCDVFCPESGGPHQVKPRFFSQTSYDASAPHDGFLLTEDGLRGRFSGVEYRLTLHSDRHVLSDGQIEVALDPRQGSVLQAQALPNAQRGHRLPLWRYHAMRALHHGVRSGSNPVSAPFLPLGSG